MTKFNRALLIIGTGLLAGCTSSIPEGSTYQGYPCQQNCVAFAAGFDKAKSKPVTTPLECDSFETSQRLGCLSFLHEYQVEHDNSGGYLFPSR